MDGWKTIHPVLLGVLAYFQGANWLLVSPGRFISTVLPGGTSPTRDTLVLSTLLGELKLASRGGIVEMMEALVTDAWIRESGCEGRGSPAMFFFCLSVRGGGG